MKINPSRPTVVVIGLFCLTMVAFAGVVVFVTSLGERPAYTCPMADLNHTYDDANDTLFIQHTGGDRLRGGVTVVVADNETNTTAPIVWLPENSTAEISMNDSIAITDREGDQPVRAPWVPFDLGDGDRVHVRVELPEESGCTGQSANISEFTIE